MLVSPTIHGNVMLGPTVEDLQGRSATATSEAGFEFLLAKGRALLLRLLDEEITATYSGLRAATEHGDYLIDCDTAQRYVLVGVLDEADALPAALVDLPAAPKMANIGEAFLRPYQDAQCIAADPAYGTVVCFCERVTAGEIRDALRLADSTRRTRRPTTANPRHERAVPRVLLRRRSLRLNRAASTHFAETCLRDSL